MRPRQDSQILVLNVVTMVVLITVVEEETSPISTHTGQRPECRPVYGLSGVQAKDHS